MIILPCSSWPWRSTTPSTWGCAECWCAGAVGRVLPSAGSGLLRGTRGPAGGATTSWTEGVFVLSWCVQWWYWIIHSAFQWDLLLNDVLPILSCCLIECCYLLAVCSVYWTCLFLCALYLHKIICIPFYMYIVLWITHIRDCLTPSNQPHWL